MNKHSALKIQGPLLLQALIKLYIYNFFNYLKNKGRRDSVMWIVTRLRVGQSGVRIPTEETDFALLQKGPHRLWGPAQKHRTSFLGVKRPGATFIIHFHLGPRLHSFCSHTPSWRGQRQIDICIFFFLFYFQYFMDNRTDLPFLSIFIVQINKIIAIFILMFLYFNNLIIQ